LSDDGETGTKYCGPETAVLKQSIAETTLEFSEHGLAKLGGDEEVGGNLGDGALVVDQALLFLNILGAGWAGDDADACDVHEDGLSIHLPRQDGTDCSGPPGALPP